MKTIDSFLTTRAFLAAIALASFVAACTTALTAQQGSMTAQKQIAQNQIAQNQHGSSIGCRAELNPDTLTVGSTDVVQVKLSEWLGAVTNVLVEEGSGVRVTDFRAGEASAWSVDVDAAGGSAGSWVVTVEGEDGTCVGTVHIVTNS